MLPRILEPEVMGSAEEAQAYDVMDHSVVNKTFAEDFLCLWDGRNPILDVGTGTARIPIALADLSGAARIIAIDLAEEMLRLGRENVRRAGHSARIELRRTDAKGLPFRTGEIAAVISNSIIHHIPEPRSVFREMVRVAAPGALLFVRDLVRPPDQATLEHLVATYAGDASDEQRKLFADSLHAALTVDEVTQIVEGMGYDASTVRATSDRHWTWSAQKPADPN